MFVASQNGGADSFYKNCSHDGVPVRSARGFYKRSNLTV
jgi:hypothetical protein